MRNVTFPQYPMTHVTPSAQFAHQSNTFKGTPVLLVLLFVKPPLIHPSLLLHFSLTKLLCIQDLYVLHPLVGNMPLHAPIEAENTEHEEGMRTVGGLHTSQLTITEEQTMTNNRLLICLIVRDEKEGETTNSLPALT